MGHRGSAVLTVDEGPAPVFLRIAKSIEEDVRRGRLRAGEALPGARTLARSLGVNRNTVVAAYRELVAEGWVVARGGGGTFVADSLPEAPPRRWGRSARPASLAADANFALRRDGAPPLAAAYPRGTLVMAGGVPDMRLVPARAIARALRGALTHPGAIAALGYGDPRGDEGLRTALAKMVRDKRGIPASRDDVLVTRGSQMALELVARVVVPPGGVVVVEGLGYRPAWAAFERAGARIVPSPIDEHGIDVRAVAAIARRERVAAVYVTPHHQYPTTVTMAPGRRVALLELAHRERLAIVEDDYDHELHYEERPVLPLASADTHGNVVYIGTLSKVLAPGLRLGYVVASGTVIEQLARERFVVDRQGDQIGERAIAELIDDGTVARHVRRIRGVYAGRRDCLVALLKAAFGDRLDVSAPRGGMALWVGVRLPSAKVLRWEQRALEEGVAFVAGERFACDEQPVPFARFGFAPLDERQLREAVRRLARAFPE
ncbi:MAG: PLP-dependent aminotransferase family protein [Myxococcota bacterium]|nr:PLP-dependent aminotransferase family protein [Myxococcota bacterium]